MFISYSYIYRYSYIYIYRNIKKLIYIIYNLVARIIIL